MGSSDIQQAIKLLSPLQHILVIKDITEDILRVVIVMHYLIRKTTPRDCHTMPEPLGIDVEL
jgi:hypothetical protein